VAVLEHAYYSVISPEGCAGILWKSVEFKADAARALRFRSRDLKEFGVIDAVIEEPAGGAHRHPRQMATRLKTWLVRSLRSLVDQPVETLVADRYDKFRRMGVFLEEAAS
jgi:acetyl-CoA carboxylase carboxyl transferase subunit alpha